MSKLSPHTLPVPLFVSAHLIADDAEILLAAAHIRAIVPQSWPKSGGSLVRMHERMEELSVFVVRETVPELREAIEVAFERARLLMEGAP
jgi:hypothetical protein